MPYHAVNNSPQDASHAKSGRSTVQTKDIAFAHIGAWTSSASAKDTASGRSPQKFDRDIEAIRDHDKAASKAKVVKAVAGKTTTKCRSQV